MECQLRDQLVGVWWDGRRRSKSINLMEKFSEAKKCK
jgi:hypothetical protein